MKKILLLSVLCFLFTNSLNAIEIKIKMEDNMDYKDVIKNINDEALKVDSTTTKPIDQNYYNDMHINNKYNNSNINIKNGKVEVKTPNTNIKVK